MAKQDQNKETEQLNYEYLQYHGTIINKTSYTMEFYTGTLNWGKWMDGKNPKSVAKNSTNKFVAQGRNSAASGTEGEIVWMINLNESKGGAPQYVPIRLYFCQPYSGTATERITADDSKFLAGFRVINEGNSRDVQFKIVED